MSKQSLLLVDGDTRSLRVLEVSLRKAGFSVTPAVSVGDALDKLEVNAPDLIISETKFATDLDGFELRRRLRGMPEWAEIPFIFLTAETAIENKIKGLELGVDDYLTKPIYIKEIVTRINILLQKKQRQFLDLKKDGTRFAGRVADMPVVDVIQTIEVSRKSGVIQFTGANNRQAAIYFRDGKVIDAEAGTLQGEDAVYRLLTWGDGEFEVEFRTVRRREVINASSQGLLMEGMRRLDEWSRLLEQLPPLSHRFEIDAAELSTRLGEVPDDNNKILRLFDGKRTLLEVIDASDFGDLECLQAISRLYFEGLLLDLDPASRHKSGAGHPLPHIAEDSHGSGSRAAFRAASGPIEVGKLDARATADPSAPTAHAAPLPGPPKGVTMGWDAVADPTEAPAAAEPAPPAAPSSAPAAPAASPPKGVTMGWDAVADPTEAPAAAAPVAAEPAPAAAEAPPPEAEAPRARRDSGVQIDDRDVVAEEEVHPPLAGSYRMSSLRLIDEAVAAAQLIEPSLFEPEELARLGIKPATPAEVAAAREASEATPAPATAAAAPAMPAAAAAAEPAAPAAPAVGVTMGWDAVPDPTENPEAVAARAAAEAMSEAEPKPPEAAAAAPATAASPATSPSAAPTNGARAHRKTAPPPIPRAPAKPSPKEIADAPMLDSNLLLSGEHKIPDDSDLDDSTPLIDADLLTSGEFRIPTPAELAAAESARSPATATTTVTPVGIIHVPLPDETDGAPPEPEPDDYSGVPTVIAAEEDDGSGDVGGPTNLELPSRRSSAPIRRDDRTEAEKIRMIGSHGRDRAEASGELKPPGNVRAATEPGAATQRELVTIMPRRKTGEVAQLKLDEAETKPGKQSSPKVAEAKAAVEESKATQEAAKAAEAKGAEAKAAVKADAKADAADAKSEAKADAKPKDSKTDAKAKPAVEPPASPPRRVTVEGGVVAPRGPGRGAQILIALASIILGATLFSMCRKHKQTTTPAAATQEDAALVINQTPDATEVAALDIDAGVVVPVIADATIAVQPRADAAALVQVRPDAAAVVEVRPDAATVVQVRPDAATVAVASADAGAPAPADKTKEAKALFDKAHQALEDGDPDAALDLLEQSLKLKRTAKTLLERARALQRLRRIDEAVASIDEAIKMNESYAPAWLQKGNLLWSEQKYTDARPAFEMFLQLQPEGSDADKVRAKLEEPK